MLFEGKQKKVSAMCCSIAQDVAWIGTEGGDVHTLDLKSFEVTEMVIHTNLVQEQLNVSSNFQVT